MVRAARERSAISGSIYFLLAHYLYHDPTILMKMFVELDTFMSVAQKSRAENINNG